MSIQERLQQDMKAAMRSGERKRLDVIRMALAALKNAQMVQVKAAYDAEAADGAEPAAIDRTVALSEAAEQDTLKKEVKRRREAAEMFRKGHRDDLADQEDAEAAILEEYLPRALTADELRPQIAAAIAELGTTELSKVMPALMQRFKGLADGKLINQLARELLPR